MVMNGNWFESKLYFLFLCCQVILVKKFRWQQPVMKSAELELNLFICGFLIIPSVTDRVVLNDWMMADNNLKMIWKEAFMVQFQGKFLEFAWKDCRKP